LKRLIFVILPRLFTHKMARTPSTMIPLGFSIPAFALPDMRSSEQYTFQLREDVDAWVIMFICNHCPFVKHINAELVNLCNEFRNSPVKFIGISSNDAIQYPMDGPEEMKKHAREAHYDFPYLYDESQDIARAFDAACTPDFFLFDRNGKLKYRGQLDDSRPSNGIPVSGKDLRNAINFTLQGEDVPEPHFPSIGCNIKWKK